MPRDFLEGKLAQMRDPSVSLALYDEVTQQYRSQLEILGLDKTMRSLFIGSHLGIVNLAYVRNRFLEELRGIIDNFGGKIDGARMLFILSTYQAYFGDMHFETEGEKIVFSKLVQYNPDTQEITYDDEIFAEVITRSKNSLENAKQTVAEAISPLLERRVNTELEIKFGDTFHRELFNEFNENLQIAFDELKRKILFPKETIEKRLAFRLNDLVIDIARPDSRLAFHLIKLLRETEGLRSETISATNLEDLLTELLHLNN